MEANVDKCLAFCQELASSNQKFTFALTMGKDKFFFSTSNQRREAPAKGSDLKKAAPRQQGRRERRAADPAVKQRKATHDAAAAEEATAGAPGQSPAHQPEMGGAAGPARMAAEEAKREPCCRRCKQPVAGHPGGARGCGASCANLELTPEKLLHASDQGDLSLAMTPERGGREEQCTNCGAVMTAQHQCNDVIEAVKKPRFIFECLQPGYKSPGE
jgi:hypothetical protein